jgi:hypothetical protein
MLAGIDKNPGPKPQKKSKAVFTRKSSVSAPPKADRTSAGQLASASPTPKPGSKPAHAPAPVPASPKPAMPTPPLIAAPPIPASASDSASMVAAAAGPKNSATKPETQPATSKTTLAPRSSLPAPALRKVKPFQLASSTPSTPPAEPDSSEAAARDKPAAAPPNKLRKRAFRPLRISVNG